MNHGCSNHFSRSRCGHRSGVRAASSEDRRKLQLLLNLRLRELTVRPARPLKEVMDEMGRHAEARGLTPEILESLSRDE
jgi:hypothetical protein